MRDPRIYYGLLYVVAMGIIGALLVASAEEMGILSVLCKATATEQSTVFTMQAGGALLGAILSALFYHQLPGNFVISLALFATSTTSFIAPHIRSVKALHAIYFCFGLFASMVDTGCQVMTNFVLQSDSAPWLGANASALSIGGAIVVALDELVFVDVKRDFFTLGSAMMVLSAVLVLVPNPKRFRNRFYRETLTTVEEQQPITGKKVRITTSTATATYSPPSETSSTSDDNSDKPHYYVDICVSIMIMLLIGGLTTMTAYLPSYIEHNQLPSSHLQSDQRILTRRMIVSLWFTVAVGRLAAVVDQMYFVTVDTLVGRFVMILSLGGVGFVFVIFHSRNVHLLWAALILYGLCNGPTVAYSFQWLTQASDADEYSMALTIFGLNFGTGIVPVITTYFWNHFLGSDALLVMTALSMFCVIPILLFSKSLSYKDAVNPQGIRRYYVIQ